MITLITDTETTGIPARRELVTSPTYPHLVQIAGLLFDGEDQIPMSSFDFIVRPDGWKIPDEAAKIHGINQELALSVGVPLRIAVACYTNLVRIADRVVGHNIEYDLGILSAAIYRCGQLPDSHVPKIIVCTAILGEPLARLPPTQRMIDAGYGDKFKKPNLTELHRFLFGEGFDGAHGALADVQATARCLFEIERRAP